MGWRFNLFWSGQAVSQIGDYLALFAIPAFVATEITTDDRFLGWVFAAESAPALLVGLVGGVMLDRLRLRWIIVATDLARAATFVVLGLIAGGTITAGPWLIVVLSLLLGTMASTFASALIAIVPGLVSGRNLTAANARLSMSQQFAWVLGVSIAGIVIATSGFRTAFFVNALTFAASAAVTVLIGPHERTRLSSSESVVQQAIDGVRFVLSDSRLRWAATAAAASNFVIAFMESVMILIGLEVFGFEGAQQLSTLYIAMGVGGLIGASMSTRLIGDWGLGKAMAFGLCIYGFGFAVLTYLSAPILVYLVLVAGFAGVPIANVASYSLRQLASPPEMLGRATAAMQAMAWSAYPIGAVVWTWVSSRVGIEPVARLAPILIIGIGAALPFTAVWSTMTDSTTQPASALRS